MSIAISSSSWTITTASSAARTEWGTAAAARNMNSRALALDDGERIIMILLFLLSELTWNRMNRLRVKGNQLIIIDGIESMLLEIQ